MISWIALITLALATSESKRNKEIAERQLSDVDEDDPYDIESVDDDPAEYVAKVVHWWANSLNLDGDSYDNEIKKKDIKRLEKMTGLKVSGYGAYRIVFELDDMVLKVALTHAGEDVNQQEASLWWSSSRDPELRSMLVPIVDDHSPEYLIMARSNPLNQNTAIKYEKEIEELSVKIRRKTKLNIDLNGYNWSIHNGKLKLHDYGND